jgi:DNA-binding MarR family transcriptional regulator
MAQGFIRLSLCVNRLNKLIRKLKMDGMTQFDLKGEQLLLLDLLYEAQEGLSMNQLVEQSEQDTGFVSRNLKVLQEDHLVDKLSNGKKYKAVYILSDKGYDVMQKINRILLRTEDAARSGISQTEFDIFYQVVRQLTKNLENCPVEWSNNDER